MAKLTKTQAARQLGIARSTLYKLIDQGKLSPAPDGMIDQAGGRERKVYESRWRFS
jgi:predicted site-specific integrase-resolvase